MIWTNNFDDLPDGGYKTILVDPPWHFKTRSEKGQGRSASRHYKTMSLDEVMALPVRRLARNDCWLFLWITTSWAAQGTHVDIMRSWGAKPCALAFNWIKTNTAEDGFHFGMGYTTRKNSELCFLGRWGSPKRLSSNVSEVIISPVRQHSRKPDSVRKRITQYAAGPYCELFAREAVNGWDAWGDQLDRYTPTDKLKEIRGYVT